MNSSAFALLASTSITVVSILVGLFSYRSLERESLGHSLSLGTVSATPIQYHLVESPTAERCVGAFSLSLKPVSTQTTLALEGWVLVGLNERVEPVKLEATMLFNALGQLSVSLLTIDFSNESPRFGTIGVNPLTAQLYRGKESNKPLFEHSVPGPITLSLQDGVYRLQAPSLPAFQGLNIAGASSSLTSLSIVPAKPDRSCDAATARHIDLAPLTKIADSLQRALPGVLSGL
jgi:hypothetical protein